MRWTPGPRGSGIGGHRGALTIAAIGHLPTALRRRVIREWLLAGGATGLTDVHLRESTPSDHRLAWTGRGGCGQRSANTRLFTERHGGTMALRFEPV